MAVMVSFRQGISGLSSADAGSRLAWQQIVGSSPTAPYQDRIDEMRRQAASDPQLFTSIYIHVRIAADYARKTLPDAVQSDLREAGRMHGRPGTRGCNG